MSEEATEETSADNEKTLLILVAILALGNVAQAVALWLVYHPLT